MVQHRTIYLIESHEHTSATLRLGLGESYNMYEISSTEPPKSRFLVRLNHTWLYKSMHKEPSKPAAPKSHVMYWILKLCVLVIDLKYYYIRKSPPSQDLHSSCPSIVMRRVSELSTKPFRPRRLNQRVTDGRRNTDETPSP